MDLVPTALELARLPAVASDDQPSDGVSLVPHLLRHTPLPERTVFWRFRRHLAARSGPWKLVLVDDRPELYQLSEDPAESRNLAAAQPELVARLGAETEAWARDVDGSFARLQTTDPSARRVR